jgi:hypothetical protein
LYTVFLFLNLSKDLRHTITKSTHQNINKEKESKTGLGGKVLTIESQSDGEK